MKIICDNCRTKYSIADEKVQGKVFKIRCKKCQNIIVVRGNQSAGEASPGADEDYSGRATIESKDPPVWHLVVGREQVGPMTGAEVRERFGRHEIDSESYVWREGFADWQRLTAVSDFADLVQAAASAAPAAAAPAGWSADAAPASGASAWSAAPATAQPSWDAGAAPTGEQGWGGGSEDTGRADSANLFGGKVPESGRDLFSSQQADPGSEQGAGFGASPAQGGGLFGAASASSEAGDLFGAAAPASGNGGQQTFPSEDRHSSGGDVQMTGARHENSVLFSLSNLQALAMGGKTTSSSPVSSSGATSGADGSGLIDIRSMAFPSAPAPSAQGAADELPDIGSFSPPIAAAPVLMPSLVEERPKWILPTVIGLGGLLVVTLVILVVVLAFRKPEQQAAVAANLPQPGTTITPPPAAAKTAEKKAAAETKDAPKVAENKAEEGKPAKKPLKGGKRPGRGKGGKGGPVAVAKADQPEAKAAPSPGRPKKAGKRDDLDDLIDGAISGGGKKAPKKVAAAGGGGGANLPEQLSRGEIQAGMRKIKDRVQGCYDKFRVPGTAFVSVTIAPSGSVSGARVKGIFAGTPTGACLQGAARSATFPRFKGSAMTIDYPFILR